MGKNKNSSVQSSYKSSSSSTKSSGGSSSSGSYSGKYAGSSNKTQGKTTANQWNSVTNALSNVLGVLGQKGLGSVVQAVGNLKPSSGKGSASGQSTSYSGGTGTSGGYSPMGNYNDSSSMNRQDAAALKNYQDYYNQAKASGDQSGMARAHLGAESIRKKYGYSGGIDGSQYLSAGGGTLLGNTGTMSGGSLSKGNRDELFYDMPEYPSQEDLYDQYQQIAEEQAKVKQAQIQQGVNALTGQKGEVNSSFDEIARQAYIQNRLAKNALPQELNAMGISGGLTESANLELQSNYENNLNQNEVQRQKQLQQIDSAIQNVKLSGDAEVADLQAKANMSALDAYQKQMSAANDNYWNKMNYIAQLEKNEQEERWRQGQFDYAASRDALEDGYRQSQLSYQQSQNQLQLNEKEEKSNFEQAMKLANMGIFEPLQSMGYDTSALEKEQSQKQQLLEAQLAARNASVAKANQALTKTNVAKTSSVSKQKSSSVVQNVGSNSYDQAAKMLEQLYANSTNVGDFYKKATIYVDNGVVSQSNYLKWLQNR